jgi:hypothetical protein
MNALLLCLGVAGTLVVILAFIVLIRYLNFKETMALAEKGLSRPEPGNNKPLLRWGILVTALGLGLTLGLYTIGFYAGDGYPLHLGPWMLGGFVPLFLGLGLVLTHYLTAKE